MEETSQIGGYVGVKGEIGGHDVAMELQMWRSKGEGLARMTIGESIEIGTRVAD
jgi:hypothetical protein